MRWQKCRPYNFVIAAAGLLFWPLGTAFGQQPPGRPSTGIYVGGYSGGNNRGGSNGVYIGGNPATRDRGDSSGYYVGGYPETNPSGLPSLNRESLPFESRELQPPNRRILDTRALFRIRVPSKATVRFDNQTTKQTGSVREFLTPPLQLGKTYHYRIWAHWTNDKGEPVDVLRVVKFWPGDRVNLDLREP